MQKYIYVKIGGSFITNKDNPVSLNYKALKSLYEVLNRINSLKIIMGNGGGSFAHYTVLKHRESGGRELLVKCHEATRSLNRIIVDYLVNKGLPVTSVQTSAIVYYDEEKKDFDVFYKPVEILVETGIIPVLYGECIPTKSKPIVLSTERVFELLSRYLKPERMILLTDVPGVYNCNPKTCRNPELIHKITPGNLEDVLKLLRENEKADATGGIYGKVLSMSKLAVELKIDVVVVSGFDVESVIEAIRGGIPRNSTLITHRED